MPDTETTTEKPASRDQKVVRQVARALYRLEDPPPAGASREEKSAAWKSKKPDYMKRARKLCRLLENGGVNVTMAETASESASAEAD